MMGLCLSYLDWSRFLRWCHATSLAQDSVKTGSIQRDVPMIWDDHVIDHTMNEYHGDLIVVNSDC